MDKKIIEKAYNLIMDGYAPSQIKDELRLTQKEWFAISISGYYSQLLLNSSSKQTKLEQNIKHIGVIEKALFNALDMIRRVPRNTEMMARYQKQIKELSREYSQYSIYN